MRLNSGIIIFGVILPVILFSSIFADEPYSLEKIVVRRDSAHTMSNSEIKDKNYDSVTDTLDYISGVDLRYRGTSGIQGDLSLRGSTYEQVAVLIDGIKIIDPQTGHYNLDIPLTLFDIERIEVMKEGASSLYGAGPLAGSINIITKKPQKKVFHLNTLFGEHALNGCAFSFSLPQENLSSRFSFDYKISKAARANTDFEYKTASIYLNKDFDNAALDTLFGYEKKDFGADSFYSNLFPEEEEHTETFFLRAGLDSRLDSCSIKNDLSFRKHRDKFILQRNNPASVNYHTTYVYGLNSNLALPTDWGDFIFGIDTGRDEIYSTNLGKHTRLHEAASLGFVPKLNDRLTADIRLRLDQYQKWNEQESFNFGASYSISDRLKFRGSISRSFRIPSFTELYYSDAANIGNTDLKLEKSDNFNLGFNFMQRQLDLGIGYFYRKGKNLIDWTRNSSSVSWQATNLGRVDFQGIELSARLKPRLVFSYNYTHADKKASGFFSKYALDILKHQLILEINPPLFDFNFNWQLSYNQRYYGETYFVGNVYIGRKFLKNNFNLEPFIRIDNFSNTKYTEVSGVLQPGRWIKSGLKFEW
jgi:iron complex outermembrane receptor protein